MRYSIPNKIISTGPEDGPEEGEIVSDDFEDISDESIIFAPCNGKSLSRSDHLNALSLSSVTDIDDFPVEKPKKRKRSYCQRHAKRRKRSRRKLVDSDSSDDDTTLDRRLKLQLKAAVRVDVEEAHKNSLRTRLRAMAYPIGVLESDNGTSKPKLKEDGPNQVISSESFLCLPEKDTTVIEIDSGTDSIVSAPEIISIATETILSASEVVLSAPENFESVSEQSKDDIDSELIQLRIEALKTAINNKFANRKRRKKDNINSTPSDDTNKENTNNNNGEGSEINTENVVEVPQISPQLIINEQDTEIPSTPEEDEDVLRALLLASMSKKITSIEPEPKFEPIKPTATRVQAKYVTTNLNNVALKKTGNIHNFKLNNVKKVVNNGKTVVNMASGNTKLVKIPQVKPLIISVNSDSDSDLDLSSSPEKSPKKLQKDLGFDIRPVENNVAKNLEAAIESSVDKFLREQRAKVESEVQKINKPSSELVTNVVKIKENDVTTKSTAPIHNEITLGSTVTTKNTRYTKTVTSNINKISSSTNKPISNTNKYIHSLKSKPENPNHLKLADLEKSALKFLPENKREEYKQLQNMLKLRKAQLKKPRIRRSSVRLSESNNAKTVLKVNEPPGVKTQSATKNNSYVLSKAMATKRPEKPQVFLPNKSLTAVPVVSKAIQNKAKLITRSIHTVTTQKKDNASQLSKIEVRNQERRNQQLKVEARNQERKSDALLLHATLKQMQTRIDGRLQIQERYKSLRPLIKKINDVSKEQKHWDHEVKRLLEQLTEARKKQQEVHQSMSAFVKNLAEKKQRMDESPAKSNIKPKINHLVTSTPLKQNISVSSLDISAVDGPNPPISSSMTITNQMSSTDKTLVNNSKDDSKRDDEILKENESKHMSYNTWEQSTKLDSNVVKEVDNVKRVLSDTELIVVDPNDIDKIIQKTVEKVAVLEKKGSFECRRSEKVRYVSPLDSVKRKEEFDPFAIMCPFEVNGTCKDSECTFKHLPK